MIGNKAEYKQMMGKASNCQKHILAWLQILISLYFAIGLSLNDGSIMIIWLDSLSFILEVLECMSKPVYVVWQINDER